MMLRRIIEHVKNQQWTAIGIDFVIVVIGVFVGIQVSNWNQARVSDQQAAAFTAHLKEDLREENWGYQLMIEYSRDVLKHAEIAVGALGLIADRSLRNTAMRVYNMPTIEMLVREGMSSRYREAFRMTLPNPVQRALASNCGDRLLVVGDYRGIESILDFPCKPGLSEEDISAAASALRANPELLPLLRLRIADIDTRLADLTGNNRPIMEGLRAIAEEKP